MKTIRADDKEAIYIRRWGRWYLVTGTHFLQVQTTHLIKQPKQEKTE